MDLQLKDKVVLITGGAKGIGAAITRGCAREGAVPVFVDKDVEAGKQLQAELRSGGATCGPICAHPVFVEKCAAAGGQTPRGICHKLHRSEEHTSELPSRSDIGC